MANDINDHFKLPDDLLIEILFRSSVKCLLHAKCVSKQWYTIIVNPDFSLNHLQYQKSHNEGHLLLEYYQKEPDQYGYALFDDENLVCNAYYDLDYLRLLINGSLHIEGPIDGLYCLSNGRDRLVLSNLAMMKFKPLPLPHFHFFPDKILYEGLMGFGIDPSTHDYKLLLVRTFDSDWGVCSCIYIAVYKHATNTWKLLYDLHDYHIAGSYYENRFFLNGIYYWGIDRGIIIKFDMLEETFGKILGPDTSHSMPLTSYIAPYNNMLSVLKHYDFLVELWVMLEEGVWIKQISVTSLPKKFWVIGLWKNDGLFFTANDSDEFDFDYNSQMILSDFKTQDKRMVGPRGANIYFRAYLYYESFVSVYHRTELKGNRISLDAISNYLNRNRNPYLVMEEPQASLFDQRRVDKL